MKRLPAFGIALLLAAQAAHAQTSTRPAAKPTVQAQQPARPAPRPAAPAPQPVRPVPAPVVYTPPPEPDLPRTTFIQSMDAEFRKRDPNGDGKITRAELEQFERNVAIAAAQVNNRALFNRLDTDRNGVVTPGEFAALVQDPGTPNVTPLMTRFDANRDQNISIVEYRSATLANFDRLDADKDGVLTDAEVKAGGPKPIVPGSR